MENKKSLFFCQGAFAFAFVFALVASHAQANSSLGDNTYEKVEYTSPVIKDGKVAPGTLTPLRCQTVEKTKEFSRLFNCNNYIADLRVSNAGVKIEFTSSTPADFIDVFVHLNNQASGSNRFKSVEKNTWFLDLSGMPDSEKQKTLAGLKALIDQAESI